MDAEQIVDDVAQRVRAIVLEAEERAAQIIRDAEEDAQRIRARAEEDGRGRLDEFRRAFDELDGKLGANNETPVAGSGPGAEIQPAPVTVPEPSPPSVPEPGREPFPAPAPEPPTEPEPPLIPEPIPPPDEGTPPEVGVATPSASAKPDDLAAARLVGMNMALDGASREAIEAHLADFYGLANAGAVVDDVFALTSR